MSVIDITPPAGLAMAGFAARTGRAVGNHDQLTVRALVVGETALVTADVIGIGAALSKRVRERSTLPDEAITITATHTHSAPVSMAGRLSGDTDPAFMERLEAGLLEAIDTAVSAKKPAQLLGGVGLDPGFAKNRRHKDGAIDKGIPILRVDDGSGRPVAILVSYACHPVVLGADNLLWTADYIHFFRKELETAFPGAVAIFATGCAGDINTGHTAASSLTTSTNSDRSFATAEKIGKSLAQSVCNAELCVLGSGYGAAEAFTELEFFLAETGSWKKLAAQWQTEFKNDEGKRVLLEIWIHWAKNIMAKNIAPVDLRCTALNWGGAALIALPGEIFAETALRIRQKMDDGYPVFLLSYADDNPGYIPPKSEYCHGGYEIEEAHRFYGLGAAFAPGSAERLEHAGRALAENAAFAATQNTRVDFNSANEGGYDE